MTDIHDCATAFDDIEAALRCRRPAAESMRRLVRRCSERLNAPLNTLMDLDYAGDALRIRDWMRDLLRTRPPGEDVRLLWFGLVDPGECAAIGCNLGLKGMRSYDPDDQTAAWTGAPPVYAPREPARSPVLAEIRRAAVALGGETENAVDYALALGDASLAVRDACMVVAPELLRGRSDFRYVTAGWDAGDWIDIGTVDRAGFLGKY